MSNPSAARGPLALLLKSPLAQYVVVGTGAAYSFFPEQVEPVLRRGLAQMGASFKDAGSFGNRSASTDVSRDNSIPRSIVIHTHGGSSERSKVSSTISMIVSCVLGASVVWLSYSLCSIYLPESIKEYLPVTRQAFDTATKNLAQGIINVKNILSKQIMHLCDQQERLEEKQEATHQDVKLTQQDVKSARQDISLLQQVLNRCEGKLEDTQSVQGYTARGVKLLVRCVASIMPGDQLEELADYHRSCPKQLQDEESDGTNRGDSSSVLYNKHKQTLGLYGHPDPYLTTAASSKRLGLPSTTRAETEEDAAGLERLVSPYLQTTNPLVRP